MDDRNPLDVEALQKKYPVTHGRDFGERLTLGDILDRVEAALITGEPAEYQDDVACDILDRDFLFGAWGQHWEPHDAWLLRDIRGAIIAAYRRGVIRGIVMERA